MNPKETTLLFDIADKLDSLEARVAAIETRQNKIEDYFFKQLKPTLDLFLSQMEQARRERL